MEKKEEAVRKYFENALAFDEGYESKGGPDFIHRIANHFFRPFLLGRRWTEFFSMIDFQNDDTVVDVGCGSGRYIIELSRRGIKKGTGIDFSSDMINLCKQRAGELGVKNVEFSQSDINETVPLSDILYSLGFLTYYKNIDSYLDLFSRKARRLIILEFPGESENIKGAILKCLCFAWAKMRSLKVNTHSKKYIDDFLSEKGFYPVKSVNYFFSWLVAYEKKL
ncbi:MAG: class I SAM-dependent methyltransferase [Nitrospirae bacterium]|nr:class I SAM-dependent methyltransferase [Nitrospirota bacterium]